MKKRLEELAGVVTFKGDDDPDCLSEYIILMKRYYLSFKQRCKYHHVVLTHCLLTILVGTKFFPTREPIIAVPDFDCLHPNLLNSVVESMKITRDPSHKHWVFVRMLDDARQA